MKEDFTVDAQVWSFQIRSQNVPPSTLRLNGKTKRSKESFYLEKNSVSVHETESTWRVFKPEWHKYVLIVSIFYYKCCLRNRSWIHLNLVKAGGKSSVENLVFGSIRRGKNILRWSENFSLRYLSELNFNKCAWNVLVILVTTFIERNIKIRPNWLDICFNKLKIRLNIELKMWKYFGRRFC